MSDEMILGLIFFIIGLILGLVDVILIILHKKKKKCYSAKVEATIVEAKLYKVGVTADRDRFYYSVYEYVYNGMTYTSQSKFGTSACPKIGKKRTLFLNPENPEQYIEKRFMTYLANVILSCMCVFWSLIGLVFMLVS